VSDWRSEIDSLRSCVTTCCEAAW